MKKYIHQYEKSASLLDKFYVYANWECSFTLDDCPRYPDIDFSQYQKIDSVHTKSLNYDMQLDQYQNESKETIYQAIKGPPGIFRLGKLSSYLTSCVAFCFIESTEHLEVSLHLICNCPSKFFLNGSLVAMDAQAIDQFVKCKLKKGNNLFAFECYRVAPDSEINIRLADLRKEEENSLTALECGNASVSNRFLSVLYEGDEKGDFLSYYAYLDDQVHRYNDLHVDGEVLDTDLRCIGTFVPCINKKSTIQLTDYPLYELEIPVINIRFTVWDGNTFLYETHRRFILGDLTHINEAILTEAERTIKDPALSAYDRYALKQCVKFAYDIGKEPNIIWTQTSFIRSLLFHLHRGLHMEDIYRLPKKHNIHFKNPLDGRDDMYMVVVPEGYAHEREYPLIINISNANRESHFEFYEENLDQGVIFADFYLKGITLGSYIGEAEFFALLNDIKKRFHIDENRIYLTGGCNGAYAVLALAQNYPHFFAGIIAVAGRLYLPALYNLLNIPVYNVFSNADLQSTQSMRKQYADLTHLPLVQSVQIEACTHTMLMKSMQRRKAIEELLHHVRDCYPRDIRYYTERNCHNKCYWLESLGIAFGTIFAEMEAHADSSSITLVCKNSIGVTIRIPPYVNRQSFQVHINGLTYQFTRYRKSCLTFVLHEGQYVLTDEKQQVSQLKGVGIIGVYRKPLTIICDRNDPAQMQVATVLSRPRTMGFRPEIAIEYPIHDYGYVYHGNRNLILIRKYGQATEYDDLLLAKPAHTGFSYQGDFYEGAFVILETVEVPSTKSIVLVVTYHDERLLSKPLFLRNMILPGYFNGNHGFLNNRIVAFDGQHCSAVYEPDASMTLV